MTRSELIANLAQRFPDQSPVDAKLSVKTILDGISTTLAAGGRIEIRGFGTFNSLWRAARSGRNPRTGEPVEVQERRILLFKPARELRQRVNITSLNANTGHGRHTRSADHTRLQPQD